jgi:hypothetical protein
MMPGLGHGRSGRLSGFPLSRDAATSGIPATYCRSRAVKTTLFKTWMEAYGVTESGGFFIGFLVPVNDSPCGRRIVKVK